MNNSSTPAVGRDYATTSLPLEALSIHPSNVRRTAPDSAAMHELMASIVAHGLLMPLLVVPKDDDTYQIVAGGRRLTALKKLTEEDTLPAQFDAGIPAVVLDASVDAQEISLVENTLREAMSPADAIDAFRGLFDRGHDIISIALRFGVAESTVKKYVALGGVIPEVLDLFRKDKIGLDEVQAFAFTDDQDRQRKVFDLCAADDSLHSWNIRKLLSESTVRGDNPMAVCVGIDAYRGAGGQTTDDLFSERNDVVLNNPEILQKLFGEKVEAERARFIAEGWKWADFSETRYEGDHTKMKRAAYIEGVATEAEQAKLDALQAEYEAYEETSDFDEMQKVEADIERIESAISARDSWDDEVKAQAGVMIFLGRDGALKFEEGYVRSEDEPAKEESDDNIDQPKEKPIYSRPMVENLERLRTQIVSAHLATMPELALDILAYDLTDQAYSAEQATSIRANWKNQYNPEYPQCDALVATEEALDRSWLKGETAPDRFDAFCTMSHDAKMAWLAWAVSRALQVSLAASHSRYASAIKEHIIARMDIDWAQVWRPDDTYFGRLSKTHLLKIAEELMDTAWAEDIAGLKKAVIVSKLIAVVKGETKATSPEQAQIIAAWVPPGFVPVRDSADEEIPEESSEETADAVFPPENDEAPSEIPKVLAG